MVPIERSDSVPTNGEIMVKVIKKNCRKRISVDPKYLIPLEPMVGSDVVVVAGTFLGMVGVVKEQLDKYFIVTFTVDPSRDHRFEAKDLATLEELT